MRKTRDLLVILGAVAAVGACGTSPSGKGGGGPAAKDAGFVCAPVDLDGGYTNFPATYGTPLDICACPTETAANFSTNAACGSGIMWTRSFPSQAISSTDTLTVDIDFAGTVPWDLGLLDMPGHVGFPSSGGPALSTTDWNCVHYEYDFQQDGYIVYVNGAGSHTQSATLPMTVSGIQLSYSGSAPSSAWIDSIVVTYTPMGSAGTQLFAETFDNPEAAMNGLKAGAAYVGTPPSSIPAPFVCQP